MSRPIRRALVIQPYGIGDLLFMTPALRALKLMPGVECVDVVLGSRTDIMVKNNPHVDEIMVVDKDRFHRQTKWQTFKEVFQLAKKLRRKKYDLMLDFSLRSEYAFLGLFFLGIKRRAGFAYKRRARFHNIKVPLQNGFADRHVADYYCDLAQKAGVPVLSRWLEFYPEADLETRLEKLPALQNSKPDFAKCVVMSPGGGESWGKDAYFKRWSPQSFAHLSRKIAKRLPVEGTILVGSPGEKELAQDLESSLDGPVYNLVGELSLEETAGILGKSLAFIGNDGGLLHLARAMGKPVAGVYGPVDHRVYGPYPAGQGSAVIFHTELECRPCYKKFRYKSDCAHRDCLVALSADKAIEQLEEQGFLDYLSEKLSLASA